MRRSIVQGIGRISNNMKPTIHLLPKSEAAEDPRNNRMRIAGIAVTTGFLLAGTAFSATGGRETQNLLDLLTIAKRSLDANADVVTATMTSEQAHIEWQQARAGYLPTVNAGASLSRSYAAGMSGSPDASLTATASMRLFDGLVTRNTGRRAGCAWLASRNSLDAQKQEVLYSVMVRYVQALLDSEVVVLERENLEAQRAQQRKIEAFQAEGEKSLADVLSERYLTAQAELRWIEAHHAYEVDKLNLSRTMGDTVPSGDFTLCGLTPDSTIPGVSLSGDTLLGIATERRKDLYARRENLAAAGWGVAVAKGTLLPSLSASAGADAAYGSDAGRLSAGLSLSIPIFNRFATLRDIKRARLDTARAYTELVDLKRQIAFEIRQAILGYELAEKQLSAAETQLVSAGEAFDIVAMRYDIGSAAHTDLVVARTQYNGAALDKLKARYGILSAAFAIVYMSGNIDTVFRYLTRDKM